MELTKLYVVEIDGYQHYFASEEDRYNYMDQHKEVNPQEHYITYYEIELALLEELL